RSGDHHRRPPPDRRRRAGGDRRPGLVPAAHRQRRRRAGGSRERRPSPAARHPRAQPVDDRVGGGRRVVGADVRAEGAVPGGDTSSWSVVSAIRPIPRELRHLPEVRAGRWVLGGLVVAFGIAAPFIYGPSTVNLMSVALIWGIVSISLVVLTGWAGHISLGQF